MKPKLSNRLVNIKPSATLAMAQAARDLASSGVDVMVMSAGEPDFDTPLSIKEVAKKAIDEGKTHYSPVRGNKQMIDAIIHKFSRDQKITYAQDEVMCTVGAKSAIMMALKAVVNEGDEVIIFSPYWVSYNEQILLSGAKPIVVKCHEENGFMPTKSDIRKAMTPKTKAIILNSPNNPTGAVISKDALEDLSDVLKDTDIWLISDEIYEKLLFDDEKHFSPASISEDMKARTIIISGVSKAYAMTGWRVGFAGARKDVIAAMMCLQGQEVTCLPEFIQDAASFAIKETAPIEKEIKKMLKAYAERRQVALDCIATIPHLKVFKPKGAFYVWVDFSYYIGKKAKDDMDLSMRMLKEAHVSSVPGSPFGGDGYLRFSIASSIVDIKEAFLRIDAWLKK